MFKRTLFLLISTLFLAQCTEVVKPSEEEIGRGYFPVAIGNYWIYDVTETNLVNFKLDSVRYQVREIVDTTFTDQSGLLSYQIRKSRRANASMAWEQDSLIILNQFPNYIKRTQNNYSVVNLVFPVSESKTWNANRFNFNGNNNNEQEFRYEKVDSPFLLNNISFDKTLKVVQGEPNLYYLDNRFEIYSYGTGLIYKHFQIYQNDVDPVTKIAIDNKYISGKKRTMKLIQSFIKP